MLGQLRRHHLRVENQTSRRMKREREGRSRGRARGRGRGRGGRGRRGRGRGRGDRNAPDRAVPVQHASISRMVSGTAAIT